jgi:hypothetical protein
MSRYLCKVCDGMTTRQLLHVTYTRVFVAQLRAEKLLSMKQERCTQQRFGVVGCNHAGHFIPTHNHTGIDRVQLSQVYRTATGIAQASSAAQALWAFTTTTTTSMLRAHA